MDQFPNHGSFFNILTLYGSLRSTKILRVYLFKINIYNGIFRCPELAGISYSLTNIATGNRYEQQGFKWWRRLDNQISFFETLGLVILVAKSLKPSRSFYVKESYFGVI